MKIESRVVLTLSVLIILMIGFIGGSEVSKHKYSKECVVENLPASCAVLGDDLVCPTVTVVKKAAR